ncbi:MAG TPA: energy transducer TonB [Terracidiphilus sp.]
MNFRTRSLFRLCIASVMVCGSAAFFGQSPSAIEVGPQAVKVLVKQFAMNPQASDRNTHQPLRSDGTWAVAKSRPASCPAAVAGCVEVFYAVEAQGVKCSWIISLNEAGTDGTILDENDDAATYMVRTLRDSEAKALVESRSKPLTPPIATAAHVSGNVVTRVLVGKTGEVEGAWSVSGPPMLIQASLDAAKKWKFLPMKIGARDVEYELHVVFAYYPPINGMMAGAVKLAP